MSAFDNDCDKDTVRVPKCLINSICLLTSSDLRVKRLRCPVLYLV
jgi:hypothetical protein